MRRRDREVNIFNIAFLDVITGAMGAFVLMVLLLAPYYSSDLSNQGRDQAVRESLNRIEQNINAAARAAQLSGDSATLKKLLADAQSALEGARQELQGLRRQFDQLSAQNKRLSALDQRLQAELGQVRERAAALEQSVRPLETENRELKERVRQNEQQIAKLQQQPTGEQRSRPLILTVSWPCPAVKVDVHVWSQLRPGVNRLVTRAGGADASPANESPPFDPEKSPQSTAEDTELREESFPFDAKPNITQAGFSQWIFSHADWHSRIRIFYVLSWPMTLRGYLPDAGDACVVEGRVGFGDRLTQLKSAKIDADTPVVLAGIVRFDDDGTISVVSPSYPGRAQMTEQERTTVDDFLKKTEDARDPLRAAHQGKATSAVRLGLEQELGWLRRQQTFRRVDNRIAGDPAKTDAVLQKRIDDTEKALSSIPSFRPSSTNAPVGDNR